jgi:hypothetical protein
MAGAGRALDSGCDAWMRPRGRANESRWWHPGRYSVGGQVAEARRQQWESSGALDAVGEDTIKRARWTTGAERAGVEGVLLHLGTGAMGCALGNHRPPICCASPGRTGTVIAHHRTLVPTYQTVRRAWRTTHRSRRVAPSIFNASVRLWSLRARPESSLKTTTRLPSSPESTPRRYEPQVSSGIVDLSAAAKL